MDTGALASSSAAESEEASEGSSEVDDSPSAEGRPTHSGQPKDGLISVYLLVSLLFSVCFLYIILLMDNSTLHYSLYNTMTEHGTVSRHIQQTQKGDKYLVKLTTVIQRVSTEMT